MNPAEQAANEAQNRIYDCIDKRKSFRVEAGAGAGKTYSLIKALKYLIDKEGGELIRQHQRIACITFTNVAKNEIDSRTDRHPVVHSDTIHSFCWSIIKQFQCYLRQELPNLSRWPEKLEEVGGVGARTIDYKLGHMRIEEGSISIRHDDVLELTVALLRQAKFRAILADRYPILFIDEYQDSEKSFIEALKFHFLDAAEGPLIGLFGDHWQKIYGTGCGKIEHPALEVISKGANFRSVNAVVEVLNRMRPELPQAVKDSSAEGSVAIYHTNEWTGQRRTESNWKGDLPANVAHKHLEALREHLTDEGWDFSPDKTKILMLTHSVLAAKQGYSNLAEVFRYNEAFVKKEDPYIAFFVDILEPVCAAYADRRFGEMFSILGGKTPAIRSHADKVEWDKNMNILLELRANETIGAVIDHLQRTKQPHLPDAVERKEREFQRLEEELNTEKSSSFEVLQKLKNIRYQEVIALAQFLEEKTPFATKHGVKGAEFENVLMVVGRGWNHYDFNQMLEWAEDPNDVPPNKKDAFERNRNLFYVECSRPKKRLAILFTQKLSGKAVSTLERWFGGEAIHSFSMTN